MIEHLSLRLSPPIIIIFGMIRLLQLRNSFNVQRKALELLKI